MTAGERGGGRWRAGPRGPLRCRPRRVLSRFRPGAFVRASVGLLRRGRAAGGGLGLRAPGWRTPRARAAPARQRGERVRDAGGLWPSRGDWAPEKRTSPRLAGAAPRSRPPAQLGTAVSPLACVRLDGFHRGRPPWGLCQAPRRARPRTRPVLPGVWAASAGEQRGPGTPVLPVGAHQPAAEPDSRVG